MISILNKHLTETQLITITQIDSGALVEEIEETETFKGAFFPTSGQEYRMELDGTLKVNSLKLYTKEDIISDFKKRISHKIIFKDKKYTIKSKKEYTADDLKIYLLEVLDD